MVSYEHVDAIEVVRAGLNGRRNDEQTLSSATVLAERLGRIHSLGGLFEQISFSPQVQSLLSHQSVELAV